MIRTYEDAVLSCRVKSGRHHILHLVIRHEPIGEQEMAKLRGSELLPTMGGRVVVVKRFALEVTGALNFAAMVKAIADAGVTDWDAVVVAPARDTTSKQRQEYLRDMERRLWNGTIGDFAVFSRANKPLAPIAAATQGHTRPPQARPADLELVREIRTTASAAETPMRLLHTGGEGYKIRHNKKHRVLVRYGGGFVPVMWLSVSPDGSICLGPYIAEANFARLGVARSSGAEVFVDYGDGEQIDITDIRPVNKVTIHSSGCVHMLGRRAFRKRFRELEQQEELCFLLFQHPDHYKAIAGDEIKATDIVCNFEVSSLHPYYCQVLVSPVDDLRVVQHDGQRQEWRAVLMCETLPQTSQGFAFQLYLGDKGVAPWPPYSFLVLRAEPDNWKEQALVR